MALVRIICDGGGSMGFGNLQRSSVLAATFKRSGFHVAVDAVSAEACRLLPSSFADRGETDLWVLDLPYDGDRWVAQARSEKRRVLALDYQGNIAPDLVISVFDRGTAPRNVRQLVGLDYVIIRPDVLALAPAPPGRGCLVMIGGGEKNGLGERAALRLHAEGAVVTLVEGPLAAQTREMPEGIARLKSPSDLAQWMASSSWGVTGAGTAMMEMICLGKPVHILPRTLAEEALARIMMEKGILLGVGLNDLRIPAAAICAELSARGHELIDGKGAERIVRAAGALL